MSAITLSNITWSPAEESPLFSQLDLRFSAERVGIVGRNGTGKTSLLRLIAGDVVAQSGAVAIDGRVGVLRQSLQLQPGQIVADLFGAGEALAVLRRAEAGEAGLDEIADADWTLDDRIDAALSEMGLDAHADTPVAALSGGQRTRAALAGLVFGEPDWLLLDEPTNNLDDDGRATVAALLGRWRRGAIVVSHDRMLLETMDAIVELTTLGAARYGGNYSFYRERKALELASLQQELSHADKSVGEMARAAQAGVERKARKDAVGKRKAARGDQPRIVMGLRKDRAEDTGGKNARIAARLRDEAAASANAARERVEVLEPFRVTLAPSGLAANRVVIELEGVTAGHVSGAPVIRDLALTLQGPERVALTGPNGSGKTTLLAIITGLIPPWAGEVRVVPGRAMLDQQVSILDPALSILDNFVRLNPDTDENACRAALARFRFRADAALQIVGTLSGGQMLRAGLACVVGGPRPVPLLILDEPTNHLDLESIEAVEAGLRAYDGALLVVSHDAAFLDAIGIDRRINLSN